MCSQPVEPASPDPGKAASPTAVEAQGTAGPRLYGVIDVLRTDRIAGWAIDRSDAAAAVEIDVLREGKLLSRVRADRKRADLEKAGVGTGAYGFRVEIDPPLAPGLEFTVTATARSADGVEVELARGGRAVRAPVPGDRLLERVFEEVVALRAAQAVAVAPNDAGDLDEILDRVEVAQARIEAAVARLAARPQPAPDHGVRRIALAALVLAIVSLGTGLYSLLAP